MISRQVAIWLLLPLVGVALVVAGTVQDASMPPGAARGGGGLLLGVMGLALIPVLIFLVPLSLDPGDCTTSPGVRSRTVHALICTAIYLATRPDLVGHRAQLVRRLRPVLHLHRAGRPGPGLTRVQGSVTARTQSTSGRWELIRRQLSPASAEPYTSPLRLPK